MSKITDNPLKVQESLEAWTRYVQSVGDWQKLIAGVEPVASGCGPIYELKSPLGRPGEEFAIADMRAIDFAEPHYHPRGNWEIYIVFEGKATVILGGKKYLISKDMSLIIPPETAHFTLPDQDCVIAAINIPPFKPENYVKLTESDLNVGYDHGQFLAFTQL